MFKSRRYNEVAEILDKLQPVSASSVQNGAWVSAKNAQRLVCVMAVGVIAATGTLDLKLQQAKDGSGTGVKDITGKAIVQLTQAGGDSGKTVEIECLPSELDVTGGFSFVRFVATPATAASLLYVQLLAVGERLMPVAQTNWAQAI